jgi:hypothetical protein
MKCFDGSGKVPGRGGNGVDIWYGVLQEVKRALRLPCLICKLPGN